MKVMLVNLPWRKGNLHGIRAGSRWPFMMEPDRKIGEGKKIPGYMPFPFFLGYAASLLEKEKIDTLLVDALAEGLDDGEFLHKFTEYNPDFLLIETATASVNSDIKWVEKLRSEKPGVKVAFSGPHATFFAKELLEENSSIDYILCAEYEMTLLQLIKTLSENKDVSEVEGIFYRTDNSIEKTPSRKLLENIDEFPWPARHFLPMYSYNDSFSGFPSPNVQIWASRGCPFTCIFCSWPGTMYGGTTYRTRDYMDVIDEVEYLIKEYDFKAFYFDDDTFNIGKERIIKLSREIGKRGIKTPWAIMARADTTDEEVLEVMKANGLYALKFGVESGDKEVLEASGKKLDLGKVEKSVMAAKALGIKVHLTFTFGLPGETEETIKRTIEYAKKLNPDSVQFSVVTPFPGTKYFNMLEAKGFILTKNWDEYDGGNHSVIRTEKLSGEDLIYWMNRAVREWNRFQFTTKLMKHPFRTAFRGIKKPGQTLYFIKSLVRGARKKK